MQAALDHLWAQGETLNDEDIARLSPLCHGHINMLGHYSFTLAGTGDQRTSETIKRGVRGRKRCLT
ncbi:Tn3 family transposase (plasmid) [Escherichia coli]|nr:Tn3 family transposase [Escherichia coli]